MRTSSESPSPKRIKLDPPLSPPDNGDDDEHTKDDIDQEHCTICLQSFLDRTIIPVCAHEFCFECILLWSEQSRKCPLCSRSFDDAYLIHHIRSQYDYQKHYLPPRSSPPPPLTGDSRTNALRNTRRERQWGRRQRRQQEEADQLERAIARRRWIYQHHLYAKHVASNPYTRYRPFPTPAQFAATPDLISRMTMFLRRELRVWPNLDVEFLTTYTISLMKSIDIRSESAVKLLSEFLDLDTPYIAGARHANAEHFAHEIYSYLRSPYRDLNMYDQMAQYDTPPEIPPPRDIERGRRWSAEPSPPSGRSRSRSCSSRRENSANPLSASRRRDSSADVPPEDRPHHRHDLNRSPRGREDHHYRNRSSARRHSPPDGIILRNEHFDGVMYPEASNSVLPAELQSDDFPVQPPPAGAESGKNQLTEDVEELSAAASDATQLSRPQGDDSVILSTAGVTRFIHGPSERAQAGGDKVADYVDDICGGSSANPQTSRKRSVDWNVHRNRTLSESIHAYLSRPTAPWYPPKKKTAASGDSPPSSECVGAGRQDTPPRCPPRLTDGPTGPCPRARPSPRQTTVERTSDGDPHDVPPPPAQPPHAPCFTSCPVSANVAFSSPRGAGAGANADADADVADGDGGATRLCCADVRTPGETAFPPALSDKTQVGCSAATAAAAVAATEGCPYRLDGPCAGTAGPPSHLGGDLVRGRAGCARTDVVVDDEVVAATALAMGGSAISGAQAADGEGEGAMEALERRLRAKVRVHVRLEALKRALDGGSMSDTR